MHPTTAEFLATSHIKDMQVSRHWPVSGEDLETSPGRLRFEVARQRLTRATGLGLSMIGRTARLAVLSRLVVLTRIRG